MDKRPTALNPQHELQLNRPSSETFLINQSPYQPITLKRWQTEKDQVLKTVIM